MALFIYTAESANGESYEGEVEAPDRFAVYDVVRKEGATIIDVREKTGRLSQIEFTFFESLFSRVSEAEKIILARNLATMIKAGLPISRALGVMERQTKNKRLKNVLIDLNKTVTQGGSFHEALKEHPSVFSPLFISMSRAGDESGKLADSLLTVARQIERAYTLKKKVRGALIYPSIIVSAMVGIGILMLVYVVPTLTQTFAEFDLELPATTQAVVSTSNFFVNHTLLALSALLLIVLAPFLALKHPKGRRFIESMILYMPIVGSIVKETNSARTSRTLASLLSAGVDVVEALSITEDVIQNSHYKAVLSEAQEETKKGRAIADAFIAHEELYPPLVGEMIAVGGETGQLTAMLEDVAVFYEAEVEQKTKDLSTVIEPFLMVFIGIVVGFFAVSMIAPIYSISAGI